MGRPFRVITQHLLAAVKTDSEKKVDYLEASRLLIQSSISLHNGFNNLFPTVQETNFFMEVGWLKKNEMHGDVPVSDMRHAFRAS